MTECYVGDCNKKAVIFVELDSSNHRKVPCCQKHADEFPNYFRRFRLGENQ